MNMKTIMIRIMPYFFIAYLFNKFSYALSVLSGANLFYKILDLGNGIKTSFSDVLPSFELRDILFGILSSALIWYVVYAKGKNAKKYRKGIEYGSARWGNREDIKPYTDPIPENNIIFTATERLMMSNRPPSPKYARNKNVIVIGGSGSGKTRFYVKPNLMQMHSSYVITDPNGYNIRG